MGLLTALGVGANACCPKVEAPGFFPQLWLAEVCKVDKTNVNCVNPATETFWTFEDIRNLPAGTTPPTGAVALPATQEQYSESVTIPVPIKFTGNEGFHRYDAEIDSIELTSKSEGKVGSLSTVYQLEVTLAGTKASQRGFAEKILNGCFLVSAKRKARVGSVL